MKWNEMKLVRHIFSQLGLSTASSEKLSKLLKHLKFISYQFVILNAVCWKFV
jgi:hypothetical protein